MNFTQGGNSGLDGLLWLRAIHKKHPAIPVVLVTAYADIKLAVRGLKMGAADFVAKPWDNQELIRILKDAIDAGRNVVPLEQVEAEHVSKVVERCHGNISRAAELLGITRQTLYAKMKSYDVDRLFGSSCRSLYRMVLPPSGIVKRSGASDA